MTRPCLPDSDAQAQRRSRPRLWALACASVLLASDALAVRLPAGAAFGEPTLDATELGLNEGEPQRVTGAELDRVARQPGVVLWRFHGSNWMRTARSGSPDTLADVSAEHGGRPISDLVSAFRFDMDGDGSPELLLVSAGDARLRKQYGATLLTLDGVRWRILYNAEDLPGEYCQVEDIRDLNGDGRTEVVLSARAGTADFYTSWGVLAFDGKGTLHRTVTRPPDTLHLVDLDRDGRLELIVRHLVSRRGQSHLWTFTDRIVQWSGAAFVEEPPALVRYHDEVDKRRILDELIDHYDADVVVLRIKTDVLRDVHAGVARRSARPLDVSAQVTRAREAAAAGSKELAAQLARKALERSPYDVAALREAVSIALQRGRFAEALHLLYALLGVVPDDMIAWRQMGLCFARLHERSAAIACFHNSVKLGEDVDRRMAELRRATQRERNDDVRAAKVAAVAILEGKPVPEPSVEDFSPYP